MSFNKAFEHLMQAEGGYANSKHDRGGETFYGISSKYYPNEVRNIKRMVDSGQDPSEYVRGFYKREFWDASGAEDIGNPSLQLAYFDTAVNSGIGKAKELLQNASSTNDFLDKRQEFVNQIIENDPSQAEFQNGWRNRIDGLRESDAPAYSQEDILAEIARREGEEQPQEMPYSQDEILAEIERREQEQYSPLQSAGLGLAQGASWGFADEVGSYAKGLYDGVTNLSVDAGIQGYKDAMQESQNALQSAQEQNPGSYLTGEIVGNLAGFGGVAKAAPGAVKGLANFAKKGKAQTAATALGTGGISGGVYGAGTGEGTLGERAENALVLGRYGAAGGLAGAGVGAVAGKGLNALNRKFTLTERVQNLIGKKNLPAPTSNPNTPTKIQKATPDGYTLPKGAATEDVDLMRVEEAARQGNLGQEAQAAITQVDQQFQDQVQKAVKGFAGNSDELSDDIIAKATNQVRRRFNAQKALQNKLMNARNDAIGRSKVYKGYTQSTLLKDVQEITTDPEFSASMAMAGDENAIKKSLVFLNDILKKDGDSIRFADLAGWRSALGKINPASPEYQISKPIRAAYDNWLENINRNAIKAGDDELVDKIFKANKAYKDFKETFGTNKFRGQSKILEDILQKDELTPYQLKSMIMGASSKGKATSGQVVKRLINTLPEARQEAFKTDLRKGLFASVLEDSTDEMGNIKLGKLKSELVKLKKNEAFHRYLANGQMKQDLNELTFNLEKYIKAQSRKDVYAPSAPAVARYASAILQKLSMIPTGAGNLILRPAAGAIDSGAENLTRTKGKKILFEQSLKDIKDKLINESKSTAKIYGASAGGVGAAGTVNPGD